MISVDYGARWPIKFEPFPIDEFPDIYEDVLAFAGSRIVIKTWNTMDDVARCKIIERMTIEYCKETSPKKNYGIGQAEIRGGIIDAIDINGGGGNQWLCQLGSYQSNQ